MKKIIVGIDFSRGSECAIELAIDMANKIKNSIKLVYVKSNTENDNDIKDKINKLIQRYSPTLTSSTMEYAIVEGKVSQELATMASTLDA